MAQKTIRLYLVMSFVHALGISVLAATYVMFLIGRGLNLFEVNLVNLSFFTTMILFEIPTGAVADVFGRKTSVVLSCFGYAVGMFVYAAAHTFWMFVLAEMIAAVGATLASGAFDAWLVDKLKHHGHTGLLRDVFSREYQLNQAGSIAGAIGGAYLASRNLALPWIFGGVVMTVLGVFALVLMKEEYFIRQPLSFRSGLTSVQDTIRVGFRYGINNSVVRFIFTIGLFQCLVIQAPNMQWQPLFLQFLPNKSRLGFVYAGISLTLVAGAALAPRFLVWVKDERRALITCQLVIGLGIACAVLQHNLSLALIAFLFHELGRGAFMPLKEEYLNDHIPSRERATIISLESMAHHIGGSIGLVMSGFLAYHFSIATTWILFGGGLVISALVHMRNGKD